jgi:hypothetical protein
MTRIRAQQILPSSQTSCVPVGPPVFFDIALEPVNVLVYLPKNFKRGGKRTNSFRGHRCEHFSVIKKGFLSPETIGV